MSYNFPLMSAADIRTADGAKLVASGQVWEGRTPWTVTVDGESSGVKRGALKRAVKRGTTKGIVSAHGVILGRVGAVRDAATASNACATHLPHTLSLDVAMEAVQAVATVLSVKAPGFGSTSDDVVAAIQSGDPRKIRRVERDARAAKDAAAAEAKARKAEKDAAATADADADAPQADAPQADAPEADAPEADAPQADAPAAESVPTPPARQSKDDILATVLDSLAALRDHEITLDDARAIREAFVALNVASGKPVAA